MSEASNVENGRAGGAGRGASIQVRTVRYSSVLKEVGQFTLLLSQDTELHILVMN